MARLNLVCAKAIPCDKTGLLIVSEEGEEEGEEHREKNMEGNAVTSCGMSMTEGPLTRANYPLPFHYDFNWCTMPLGGISWPRNNARNRNAAPR